MTFPASLLSSLQGSLAVSVLCIQVPFAQGDEFRKVADVVPAASPMQQRPAHAISSIDIDSVGLEDFESTQFDMVAIMLLAAEAKVEDAMTPFCLAGIEIERRAMRLDQNLEHSCVVRDNSGAHQVQCWIYGGAEGTEPRPHFMQQPDDDLVSFLKHSLIEGSPAPLVPLVDICPVASQKSQ